MNSNKSEIYGVTRFQLYMYAVKIPEQVLCIFSSIKSRKLATD